MKLCRLFITLFVGGAATVAGGIAARKTADALENPCNRAAMKRKLVSIKQKLTNFITNKKEES